MRVDDIWQTCAAGPVLSVGVAREIGAAACVGVIRCFQERVICVDRYAMSV